mmetsp:Transcript_20283/g.33655  ORF Transcript_20283/g.33655 Transcript_20283/m.33655 type:complete len:203 (+) Transcript_20283:1467-2075(+)
MASHGGKHVSTTTELSPVCYSVYLWGELQLLQLFTAAWPTRDGLSILPAPKVAIFVKMDPPLLQFIFGLPCIIILVFVLTFAILSVLLIIIILVIIILVIILVLFRLLLLFLLRFWYLLPAIFQRLLCENGLRQILDPLDLLQVLLSCCIIAFFLKPLISFSQTVTNGLFLCLVVIWLKLLNVKELVILCVIEQCLQIILGL